MSDIIELLIEKPNAEAVGLIARVECGQAGRAVVRISGSVLEQARVIEIVAADVATVKRLVVSELQSMLDLLAPSSALIKVVRDAGAILPKVSYRCANPLCRGKLFEAWGPVQGIRIVCRKCKTLDIPQAEMKRHV